MVVVCQDHGTVEGEIICTKCFELIEQKINNIQQLKAEISALATKLIESEKAHLLYEDVYLIINEMQKLSAV